MNKAVVLALVGVMAVIATGLASGGLDARGAYRELAAAAQDAPPAEGRDKDKDPTPCGAATGADDRSRDVDDDSDADCDGQVAGGDTGDNGDNGENNAGEEDPEDAEVKKITICHYEGNGSWHTITPSVSAIVKDGHDGHPNDIIPPFKYTDKKEPHEYPGKNWGARGQAILDSDCVEPKPPPSCPSKAELRATDAGGNPKSQYTFQEQVYARGQDLTPNATFVVRVTKNDGGTEMSSVSATTNGAGGFLVFAWNGANAAEGDKGYRVEASSGTCSRGDNFQYRRTGPPDKPTLIVRKTVVGAPDKPKSEFGFKVNDDPETAFEAGGENKLELDPGTYNITEEPEAGFTTTTDNCSGIVLSLPQKTVPVCTITNTAGPAEPLKLIVRKEVVNSPTTPVSNFSFTVNGQTKPFDPTGENIVTLPAGTYTVTEPTVSGFTTTYEGCSAIVVESPQPRVPACVITNTADQKPPDTVWPVGNFVKCVDNFDDGRFVAWFGYESSNKAEVTIPIGELNHVTPGVDRGQPFAFQPGRVESAFSVTGLTGETIRWELTSPPVSRNAFPWTSGVEAGADFEKKCSSPPDPPARTVDVFVTCVENTGNTYSARFGYVNPSTASVSLAIGHQNRFDPLPEYRGQPQLFTPGRVEVAVVVDGISNSVDLAWTVDTGNGAPSTATALDTLETKCSDEPPPPDPDPGPPPPDPDPGPPPPPEDRGPIGVFVQCITTRGATYDAVFGYQNDNAYTVAIPVGSDNRFVPGGDRGQTTTFLPGNHQDAFTVAGIPSRQPITWAVTYAGATRFARPDSGFTECAAEPPQLQPIGLFACIVDRGDTFDAVFGYENDNPVDVTVPIGLQNFVIPRPVNRQQPTVLSPGRHENAFTVRGVDSTILAWTVKHEGVRTVIVTSEYPIKCAGSPPTTLPLVVFPLCVRRTGSTYMTRFGYINPNHGDIVLPIGASNVVGPAPKDRGQPTTLRPGIAWSAFTVRRIPLKGSVTWTVKYAGETARASVTSDFRRNCITTPEDPEAQLEIDKSVEPDAAVVGDRVTFRIVVRNEGTTTAQNATVIDRALDDRIVQLSAKPSQGRCVVRSNGRLICGLGPLDPGEAATVTVLARAHAPGQSRNRAVVLSLPEDFGPDNVDRVTMLVSPAHSVAKPSFTG